MNLGSSNFQFNLNKSLQSGSITLNGLNIKDKINIAYYTYDNEYKRVFTNIGSYSKNMKIQIPKSKIETTLVVNFTEYSKGCKPENEITAPKFDLVINYKK